MPPELPKTSKPKTSNSPSKANSHIHLHPCPPAKFSWKLQQLETPFRCRWCKRGLVSGYRMRGIL
jgi:hypothetical protein